MMVESLAANADALMAARLMATAANRVDLEKLFIAIP